MAKLSVWRTLGRLSVQHLCTSVVSETLIELDRALARVPERNDIFDCRSWLPVEKCGTWTILEQHSSNIDNVACNTIIDDRGR